MSEFDEQIRLVLFKVKKKQLTKRSNDRKKIASDESIDLCRENVWMDWKNWLRLDYLTGHRMNLGCVWLHAPYDA